VHCLARACRALPSAEHRTKTSHPLPRNTAIKEVLPCISSTTILSALVSRHREVLYSGRHSLTRTSLLTASCLPCVDPGEPPCHISAPRAVKATPQHRPPPPRHLKAPVSATPLRRHLYSTRVGASLIAGHVRHTTLSLSVKTFSSSDLCSPTIDRAKVMVVSAPPRARPRASHSGCALVDRPMPGQAKQVGPALLCQSGQVGRERTVALGHAPVSGQWPSWGKEIPFLFPRIVKSISKLPKIISNSFLVLNS
jgi:hypothetical protein